MDPEIKKILDGHEERIRKLEEKIGQPNSSNIKQDKIKEFKGLVGGINFILENGFLRNLKSVDEIWNELKKEGYNYPKTSVTKILNVNLVNKKKILSRIKENNIWKYAIRK